MRLDLLPQLKKYNPRFGEAVRRFQTLLQEQEHYMQREASRIILKLLNNNDQPVQLATEKILDLHPALQKRVLRLACTQAGVPLDRLTNRHLTAALNLCRQPSGEISLPGNWRLVKENTNIVWQIEPHSSPPGSEYMLFEEEGTCTFLDWTFTWCILPVTQCEKIIKDNPGSVLMDYQQLHFPLRLRTFRPGDRFQPLGMPGTKKLQDFFIDEKIPRSRRPFIPLLLNREEIVWIAGYRLAESVRVTPQTRFLFKLNFSVTAP